MELKFTIDADEMFDEDGYSLEKIMSSALKREILDAAKKEVKSDKFNEFSEAVKSEITAGVKTKMVAFLSEEIALTDRWGKPEFIGSIEDLIKQRFDDILLRPVNNSGETIEGCSTHGAKTWVEWQIEKTLKTSVERKISDAKDEILRETTLAIKKTLNEFKDHAIKKKVAEIADILQKQPLPN